MNLPAERPEPQPAYPVRKQFLPTPIPLRLAARRRPSPAASKQPVRLTRELEAPGEHITGGAGCQRGRGVCGRAVELRAVVRLLTAVPDAVSVASQSTSTRRRITEKGFSRVDK